MTAAPVATAPEAVKTLTKDDLVKYLASGCKPREKWRCVGGPILAAQPADRRPVQGPLGLSLLAKSFLDLCIIWPHKGSMAVSRRLQSVSFVHLRTVTLHNWSFSVVHKGTATD